ncbi:MAG: hypothetical protein A2Y16_04325 [Tenericutes bacterium GWF2_57_13]|nr:MAG: hypothetical protein A2Y16_04325 [Tenericutes bacterium GWF2_57_13]
MVVLLPWITLMIPYFALSEKIKGDWFVKSASAWDTSHPEFAKAKRRDDAFSVVFFHFCGNDDIMFMVIS